jgi:hypothetical protein
MLKFGYESLKYDGTTLLKAVSAGLDGTHTLTLID